MSKILLLVEDYSESTKLQTALKKVGFDIWPLSNTQRLADHILTFNPQVIVVSGQHGFQSVQVGIKLKENPRLQCKVILAIDRKNKPSLDDLSRCRVDQMMEAPLEIDSLLPVLAKLLQLDAISLMDKLEKSRMEKAGGIESIKVTGGKSQSLETVIISQNEPGRMKKYDELVAGMKIDTAQTSHGKNEIKKRQNELKKGWDFDFLEEIDKLKQQFAKALFSTKMLKGPNKDRK